MGENFDAPLDAFEELTGGDREMGDYLMELLKPRIDQEKQEYAQQYAQQTTISNLYEYVQKGGMTIDFAAKETKQDPAVFVANMRRAGYKVPEARA